MGYDYTQLMCDIDVVTKDYKFIEKTNIGESVMGKSIPCLKIGQGGNKVLLAGAFHGLEYLTAAFLMRFVRDYASYAMTGEKFYEFDAKKLYGNVCVYIIPMVNPDGVDIAVHGLDITNPHHRMLISEVGIHSFNTVWQANAHGVDLNHNYDAKWSMVVEKCAPTKYGGEYPESEPETKAITELVRKESFEMLLAFHSQGREIYYDFDGMTARWSLEIAEEMAKASGYAVRRPEGTAAFGGCKDWFIKEFGKSGFTVEIGMGQNPLPMNMLDDIYEENARLTLCALENAI